MRGSVLEAFYSAWRYDSFLSGSGLWNWVEWGVDGAETGDAGGFPPFVSLPLTINNCLRTDADKGNPTV